MQNQIERDLKAAMLGGDKQKVEVLRGLKTALQYEAVSAGSVDRLVDDATAQKILRRESKKRQEAADIYQKSGEDERAEQELAEKRIIDQYLPEQLPEGEINKVVQEEISKLANPAPGDMGKIIGVVRSRLGAQADGSTIARLVKEGLNK